MYYHNPIAGNYHNTVPVIVGTLVAIVDANFVVKAAQMRYHALENIHTIMYLFVILPYFTTYYYHHTPYCTNYHTNAITTLQMIAYLPCNITYTIFIVVDFVKPNY